MLHNVVVRVGAFGPWPASGDEELALPEWASLTLQPILAPLSPVHRCTKPETQAKPPAQDPSPTPVPKLGRLLLAVGRAWLSTPFRRMTHG